METIIKTTFRHYRVALVLQLTERINGRHGVAFRYIRNKEARSPSQWRPHEHGGYTTCTLTTSDGRIITGVSACSPRDGFCYRDGRELAHFDALRQFYGWGRIKAQLKPREKTRRRTKHAKQATS